MKRFTIIAIGMLLVFFGIAQNPQGFNYQAIVRDASGQPLVEQPVSIRISLQNQVGSTIHYIETHSSTTTSLGSVNLVVGGGVPEFGLFSIVPWSVDDVYLTLEVDIEGKKNYTLLGTTKLQSVPYALHAQSATQLIVNTDVNIDDPLFEIRNKAGQIVFAVYETGIRMYVDDFVTPPGGKGNKSGFAIGGLTGQKEGEGSTEYFRVTPDSVRIYFRESDQKSNKGGFAIGGYTGQKLTPQDIMFISPEYTRLYVDPSAKKSNKSGFAIGGYTGQKTEPVNFMHLTPENYFIGHESGNNITSEGLYNSTLGYKAGQSLTSGRSNIFIGLEAGLSTTIGRWNTVLGFKAGRDNISGDFNTFLGYYAGWKNTTGGSNVFIGNESGQANQTGSNNVFLGFKSGYSNLASFNTFLGYQAGYTNTDGYYNSFMGYNAGFSNTIGSSNVFIGHDAGYSNEIGANNVYIGKDAGLSSTIANNNVIIGQSAGKDYDGSFGNVFIGQQAAESLKQGQRNVMIGFSAGQEMDESFISYGNVYLGAVAGRRVSGSYNVMIGEAAGENYQEGGSTGTDNVFLGRYAGQHATGSYNTYIGHGAGQGQWDNVNSGNNNVFIGYGAGAWETESNKLHIGSGGSGTLIYGDFATGVRRVGINNTNPTQTLDVSGNARFRNVGSTISSNMPLYITADGVLSTNASDKRLKTNIEPITNGLSYVSKLQGVKFDWVNESSGKKSIGFIAQDVEKVLPELVFTNPNDGLMGVNYAELTSVLVEAVKELKKENDDLRERLEKLEKLINQNKE